MVATAAASLIMAPGAFANDPDGSGGGTLPVCKINNVAVTGRAIINQVVANSPGATGSPTYVDPTQAEMDDLDAAIEQVLNGGYSASLPLFADAGYSVCTADMNSTNFSTANIVIYDALGLSSSTSTGRPVMVVRRPADSGYDNGIVLSAPHLNEDDIKNMTLEAYSNKPADVRAAVFSGTHRCNSTVDSDDDGMTGECDGHYKISDMAHRWHNTGTADAVTDFQVMHDALRQEYPDTFTLQLHGMVGNGDEGFEISDSGNNTATYGTDAVTRAHEAYSAALLEDLAPELTDERERHTTCQAYTIPGMPAINVPVTDRSPNHCGTNSDQGERERANGNGDRWLHLEISDYIRDNHQNVIQEAFAAIRNE